MKKTIEVNQDAIKAERARLLKLDIDLKELREAEQKQRENQQKQEAEERRILRVKMIPILKKVIRRSRRITSMVQGTMGLEGQALDKRILWELTKETAKEYLEKIDWAIEAQKIRNL